MTVQALRPSRGWGCRRGSDLIAATSALAEREEILLLGRVTFEAFRGYWPDHADDGTGISAELDQVRKVVVSSTMTDPQWQNSEVLGPDWLDQVRALKAEDGDGQIGVTGSISICHALFEAGLVGARPRPDPVEDLRQRGGAARLPHPLTGSLGLSRP